MKKKGEKVSAAKVGLGIMTGGVSLLFTGVKKKVKTPDKEFELSPEAALWNEMLRDKVFNSLRNDLNNICAEVSSDYAIISSMNIVDNRQLDAFDAKCMSAVATIELLIPLWHKYNQPAPTMCEPLKRLAMVRERRGQYEDAAFACVKAIRLGMPDDGTKGGMRGRLAKIVSTGNLHTNEEIAHILAIK